jgi:aminoglycoside phosphotransferase (APT) family kinase protein
VRSVRSLTYGITSSLSLIEADGQLLVLRWYDRGESPDAGEHHVENEVRALAVARPVLGPLVPQLVAADPLGVDAGCPSLLMTYLPGRPAIVDVDPVRLAETIAHLHAGPVPTNLEVASHWFDADRLVVPSWTAQPDSWKRLIMTLNDPEPPAASVFLHRDFHHGNVLWTEGQISGVVDWPSASTGPRGIDVAHTRANLALVNGIDAANQFLAAYAAGVPGYHQETWWDAAALVGLAQDFAGVLAFNAFGAGLGDELLAARADSFALALAKGA